MPDHWMTSCLCLTLLLLSGCQPDTELPTLPPVATAGLIPDIVVQLENTRATVERDPESAEHAGRYGLVLATYGRDAAADVAFQRATLLDPNNARWPFYHAFVLRRQGNLDRAMKAIDTGLQTKPDQIDLLVKKAEVLFDTGRFDEAAQYLTKVFAQTDRYPLAQYYDARIHAEREEWQQVKDQLEKMRSQKIDVSEVRFLLATAYQHLGEQQKAQRLFDLAQQKQFLRIANFDPARMAMDKLNMGDQPLLVRASFHYSKGEFSQALALLEKAYQKNPNNMNTLSHLVRFHGHAGNLDEAKKYYDEAMLGDPDLDQLNNNMAFAYRTAGEFDKAIDYARKAIEHDPQNPGYHADLGYSLIQLDRLAEGTEQFERSLALQPDNRDLRYITGDTLLRLQEYAKAIAMLNSALTPEDQKTIAVYRSLADAQKLSGNEEGAVDALEQAMRIAQQYQNQKQILLIENQLEKLNLGH